MFKRLLIANRGEIAVRIIRACQELGIETVAVYSEVDEHAIHVQLADISVKIGPADASQSYLNMDSILAAAKATKAEAIHPGYGFLSENARFAELCEKCGITFVGPPSKVIRMLGNKKIARSTMIAAGVPVVPGSEGDVEDIETGLKEAERIGYPVIIKAALGGGGKGMRVVQNSTDFEKNFQEISRILGLSIIIEAIFLLSIYSSIHFIGYSLEYLGILVIFIYIGIRMYLSSKISKIKKR